MVKRTRKAIESLYTGVCDVINQQETFDQATGQTSFVETTAATNQPCRLSYSTITAVQKGNAAAVKQVIKLFLSPETIILAGARVAVTQNGRTTKYKAAGQPAVYSNHQEVVLELADDWA